ncbi:StAR- lipid transfer protein 5 [Mortierella antarctica]|nr:StAR- lipid transfer protein 5 [Mortierella alpina]KAF9982184.1 StAR- lipid transfer protein 5 [Mortierella antarctica]
MASQSPLAMLVLVTPYTILYLVNQLFLQGLLDKMHFVFFELIFVIAFRKLFGVPDLTERLFPAQIAIQSAQKIRPAKTSLVNDASRTAVTEIGNGTPHDTINETKKKVKKVARKTPKKVKEHPYAKELVAMEKKLVDYFDNTEIWEKVFEETSPSLIEVYQYKARPMCYKVIAVMDNTPAVTFDVLSEITRRLEWDPLCVEAKTVAEISPGVKIQYVRTKSVWPTASRDTVVLGTVKDLGEGRYMNVTTSVEHALMPERVKEKFVRMETAVAGQMVGPEPGQPNKCRLIQVLDTDLKGWIPEKLIQMVSTKAVPEGMRNVNKLLPSIQPYHVSKTIERVALARKEAEAKEEQGVEVQEEEQVHNLKSKRHSTTLSSSTLADQLNPNEAPRGAQNGNAHNGSNKAVQRKRSGTFRVFWDSFKQNLGYGGAPGKANKVLVLTLVFAVLGPTLARFRRRR